MSRITRALLAIALAALAAPAGAAAAPTFVPVGGSFSAPIYVTSPPRDTSRLFVVERAGPIRVVRDGQTLADDFLRVPNVATDGERGLLSMAFPHDYATSGLFYVYVVAAQPLGELQVREYRRSADPDRADPASERIVWRQAHNQATNHNGGQIEFGHDGMLWLAPGDGGGGDDVFGHARNLAVQLGKVLRIDPRPGNAGGYTIPADNPFGTAVWSYGLRNPYRFSFDRGTGDLFIGDVGQSRREEIDWVRAADGLGRGADYEWACREGTVPGPKTCTPSDNRVAPLFDYASRPGAHAVTGGYLVRDPGLPSLVGRYVYADFFEGQVRSLVPAPGALDDRVVENLEPRGQLASFGEDACGHVYVVSLSGTVERIQDGAVGPCVLKPEPASVPAPPPLPTIPVTPARPDRTSPRVSIAIARRGRVGHRTTPRIALTATEACRVTVTARVAGAKLKRVRTSLRAGRRTIVRLRATRKGAQRIRRALRRQRRVTLVVSVTARDAAGNTGRVKRRLKIRRG